MDDLVRPKNNSVRADPEWLGVSCGEQRLLVGRQGLERCPERLLRLQQNPVLPSAGHKEEAPTPRVCDAVKARNQVQPASL